MLAFILIISFVFAANSNYELGRGDKVSDWRPRPVPSLEDIRIIQIASGGYHSLALTGNFLEIVINYCRSNIYICERVNVVIFMNSLTVPNHGSAWPVGAIRKRANKKV